MKKLFFVILILAGTTSYGQNSAMFNYGAVVSQMTQSASYSLVPMWFDNTVLEDSSGTLIPMRRVSAAQVIDPVYFTGWDSTLQISVNDPYLVDTISFTGALVRSPNRPTSIVDTFILSIMPNDHYHYYTSVTTNAWASQYVSSTGPDSLLKGFSIRPTDSKQAGDIDSFSRCQRASNGAIVWKVPVTDAMRHDTITTQEFMFAVPGGGLTVPAGYAFATTITFKSGDSWPVNTDTFSEYHHFYLEVFEAIGVGQVMPYYHYILNDHNMASFMLANDTTHYYPSIFLEGWSNVMYKPEYIGGGGHIYCGTCSTVSVPDVTEMAGDVHIYPNPAKDEVTLSLSAKMRDKAVVTLTNAVGQVVKAANIKVDNKVIFSTADMPSGVYFYIIETKGGNLNGRFVVSH